MTGLKQTNYNESADDVYADIIEDLEVMLVTCDSEGEKIGVGYALELVKEKQHAIYG
jgi:hypothetical protein